MYFVSGVSKNYVTVMDTRDGVAEKYSYHRLKRACASHPYLFILGFTNTRPKYKPKAYSKAQVSGAIAFMFNNQDYFGMEGVNDINELHNYDNTDYPLDEVDWDRVMRESAEWFRRMS